VLLGPHDDGGWSQAHYEGLEYLCQNMPDAHVAYMENVLDNADSEQVFRSLARQGFDFIIGTSFGYMDPMANVAEEFPNTTFLHLTGYKSNGSNFGNFFGAMEDMKYLAGMLAGSNGLNNLGGTRSPDLIGVVKVDQAWGMFQLSAVAHNNHAAYYGATEPTGHPDDKWGWAVQGALQFKNLPTGAGDVINMQAVYTDGATRYNLQSLAVVSYSMFGSASAPGAYQSIGFANAPDAVYTGTSTANGTGLENVTTWGFRGGYTHNWDPYWNTGIYGAYASIRYGNNGKAAICANAVTLLALVGTCNPDFNIAQAGIITRWTPVKNLTFSGDFTWTRIDQKYSGTVVAPTLASVAKPAAVYELKDQDSFNFLLRAQRNF